MSGRSWVRTVWVAAGVVVLVVFLFLVRDILPPFLIALATAALLDPLLDWMQRRGWSRPTAALLTFLLFLAVFLGVAMVLLPLAVTQATDLVQNLPAYYERFTDWAREYTSGHHALLVRLRLPTTIDAWLQNYHSQIESFLRALVARTVTILMTSLSKAVWLAIIPIATFYLMKDIDKIRFRVLSLLPDVQRDWVSRMGVEVGAVFVSYLRGLCIVCAGYAVAAGFVLSVIFHLPYALILSVVAGILYAVPYVGPVTTIGLGALIALTAHPSVGFVLGVAGSLLIVNEVFDQIITPRVVGGLVGLHPVVSLFALMAGGDLFGLPGMILAVPVAASVRVVLVQIFPVLRAPLPGEPMPPRRPGPGLLGRWRRRRKKKRQMGQGDG